MVILIGPSRFKTLSENIIESIGLISILFPLVLVVSTPILFESEQILLQCSYINLICW